MKMGGITLQRTPSAISMNGNNIKNWQPNRKRLKLERRLFAVPDYQSQGSTIPTNMIKVDEVLCMEGGHGEVSYAKNSFVQRRIITKTRHILEETMKELCGKMLPECLIIADLGCSSGPNALEAIWEIINVTTKLYKIKKLALPEYEVFLNDLMGNDFNTLFRSIPAFQKKIKKGNFGSTFISGMPGSFYGQLFPSNVVHFVHASSSVHFLSEVPKGLTSNGVALNKGVICLTKKSPQKVHEAYYQQFANDFTLFLSSRSREIVPGGQMVLTFRGSTQSDKPDYIWDFELLGLALQTMVLEGRIEEEKLDSFNIPLFTASIEEVKRLVEIEGSFTINKLETFTVDWGLKDTNLPLTLDTRAKLVSDGYRAATGPILASQFGVAHMDELFQRFEDLAMGCLDVGKLEILNLLVSMTRK